MFGLGITLTIFVVVVTLRFVMMYRSDNNHDKSSDFGKSNSQNSKYLF